MRSLTRPDSFRAASFRMAEFLTAPRKVMACTTARSAALDSLRRWAGVGELPYLASLSSRGLACGGSGLCGWMVQRLRILVMAILTPLPARMFPPGKMPGMPMKQFADLAKFAARPFPAGYPAEEHVTLHEGDHLDEALTFFIDQAQDSLALWLHAVTSTAMATAILRKLQDFSVFVQLAVNESVAGLLSREPVPLACNSIVAGRHSMAPFLRGVADGLDAFTGTPDMLTFTRHPLIAARIRTDIDIAHAMMLAQGAKEPRAE